MDSSSPGNVPGLIPKSASTSSLPALSRNHHAQLHPRGIAALSPRSQPPSSPTPHPAMASSAFSTPPGALAFQFPAPGTSSMFTDFTGMEYERTTPQMPGHQAQHAQHAQHVTPVFISNGFGTYNGFGTLNGFGAPNGLATQVERLNNVQDRTTAPQPKRRKTQSEYDPSHAGSSFSTLGRGMLTSATGPQQPPMALASPTPKPAETVDLTENDGDAGNAAPKEKPMDEEVCYGMVDGATVLCTRVPAPKPGMVSFNGDNYWPQIKTMLRRKQGDSPASIPVWDVKRQVFGTLDEKTAVCLSGLLDSPLHIRTDALIPTRRKDPNEVVGQPIAPRVNRVSLMIYGPRKFANSVGAHLAKHHLKLVSPVRVEPGVKVYNPLASENRPQPAMRTPGPVEARPPQHATNRNAEEVKNDAISVFDSLQETDDLPEMEACDLITTPLMKHQRQGLYFMTSREADVKDASDLAVRSTWRCEKDGFGTTFYHNLVTDEKQREFPQIARGGLLADMMGLGKTLSILSLIASTMGDASAWAELPPSQPVVPESKGHQHPSRSFHLPKPPPLPLTPLVLNTKTTLLVCPVSTLTNWEEQLKQHMKPEGFSLHIYHGPTRIRDPLKLAEYDLVMTTYGTVSSELKAKLDRLKGRFNNKRNSGQVQSPLEQMGWFRIVLDEAHMIRQQTTLAFKGICRLQASRRWAVTGTPVQNKLEDLASLLSFVRVKPFDERSKFVQHIITPFKNANPEIVPKLRMLIDTITLRRLKDKIDLPKRTDLTIPLDFDEKEQQVYDWFANNTRERIRLLTGHDSKDRLPGKAMMHILRSILQLRLICAHGKDLLNADDLAELQGMTADTPIDLSDDGDDDVDEKPALQESKAYEYLYLLQQTAGDVCFKCENQLGSGETVDVDDEGQDDVLGYMSPAGCFHVFCPACIKTMHRQPKDQRCDSCCSTERSTFVELSRTRATFEQESKTTKGPSRKNGAVQADDEYVFHTKTRALVDDLMGWKNLSMANPDEPPYKSVVFSSWTSYLDLIERALDTRGITYTRLDGSMARKHRTAAMDAFRDDPSVQVILVSITAGGLGLNLTAGNSVYVMEPQYNPALEAQAVDRVHRLGQKREVKTVRFIMKNSFEERMLDLQGKKTKLANLSLDERDRAKLMDRGDAAKQRLMDLRSLFR